MATRLAAGWGLDELRPARTHNCDRMHTSMAALNAIWDFFDYLLKDP